MPPPWSADQVLALAPDASSAAAGRKLSTPGPWRDTGASDEPPAVWGRCQGSGKTPYETVVDLSGPAYKCSCPSRKFPCKHALGLLLLWSAGQLTSEPAPAPFAQVWLDSRSHRATAQQAAKAAKPEDPEATAKRQAARADKVQSGVDELDQWLTDQVRTGLSGLKRDGYRPFDPLAARMVDAQAPGLASAVRRLPSIVANAPDWPDRLLEQLALLRLTTTAHRRLDVLPADVAATVRTQVGYPVRKEDVLATPAVRDRWRVLALRDTVEERLSTRRAWLRGRDTGRAALVLSFAPSGQPLDASLVPGTEVTADLHFYPGAGQLRALVAEPPIDPQPIRDLAGSSFDDALDEFAAALAGDPWLTAWPVCLQEAVAVPGQPWQLSSAGKVMPLTGDDHWRLLAVSGGAPVTLAALLTWDGITPLSALVDDTMVLL